MHIFKISVRIYQDFDLLMTIRSEFEGTFQCTVQGGFRPIFPTDKETKAVPHSKTSAEFVKSTYIIKDTMGLDT